MESTFPNPANSADQIQKEFPEKKMSIPHDLFPEILSHLHRLPAKSLVRFQCVSKSWFAKINDPGFIQRHHDNSSERRLLLQIWNCNTDHQEPLNYYLGNSPNENGEAVFPPFHNPYRFSKIIDCCNGLVCIRTYDDKIVIWNPSIRKYKLLPSLPTVSGLKRRNFGFGYDPVNKDYKVVSIVEYFGSGDVSFARIFKVELYSLKPNSWSRVGLGSLPTTLWELRIFFGPVSLNGDLYFLVKTPTVIRLLAFHLTTEKFREQRPMLPVGPQTLEVLGGSLYVSTYEPGAQAIVLWRLNEEWSWIRFRSVPIFEFDFQLEMPLMGWRVVLWSKDGQEVLMEMDYGCKNLFKYDIKEKTRFIGHIGKHFWSGTCLGSLLLLDGDSVH